MRVLTKLAAQHNQQRTSRSIADDRYEFRWQKSAASTNGAHVGEASTWILIGNDSDAIRPFVDVLTARGHRHRIVGLPGSDADEDSLAASCVPRRKTIRRFVSCTSPPSTRIQIR